MIAIIKKKRITHSTDGELCEVKYTCEEIANNSKLQSFYLTFREGEWSIYDFEEGDLISCQPIFKWRKTVDINGGNHYSDWADFTDIHKIENLESGGNVESYEYKCKLQEVQESYYYSFFKKYNTFLCTDIESEDPIEQHFLFYTPVNDSNFNDGDTVVFTVFLEARENSYITEVNKENIRKV